MILSLLQLKTINPLDSPALLMVKEQYDKDPDNRDKAEQVRAMDLMARKAYFSSRWQVETGSYLLLAGALVFVFFQRLIAGNEKPVRSLLSDRPDITSERIKNRRYLIISASLVTLVAIISSFILRKDLPAPGRSSGIKEKTISYVVNEPINQPEDVNYPFFRGEGSRGIAGGTGYPTEWNGTEGKNIKWKIQVPKPGKSSPVIWGDKLFLTGAEGNVFEVYCIDKNSGKIIWTGSGSDFPGASSEIPDSDAEAGMAVPTAAVCSEGVYAIFGNANLVSYDLKGKLKWAKNVGVPKHMYGFTSSLLIYDQILIVQYDSDTKVAVIGFDINTGEQKWETIRPGRPVNSSPVLANFDDNTQVLINGSPNVSAYDALSGKELWSLPGVKNDVATSLAVNSKMVFTVANYEKLFALIPGSNGRIAWDDNSYTPDVSSPVANDKYLFVTTGSGDIACYNADKGDTLWTHFFEDFFYASPIICDNKVWMLDHGGTMHIAEADSVLKIISSSPLSETTECTPVFSEKKIYIRGRVNLYCIAEN
jgi:outer membrane protein assembly factor BamB